MHIDMNSIHPGLNIRSGAFRTPDVGVSLPAEPKDSVALSRLEPAAEVKRPVAPRLARRAGAVALAVSAGVAAFAGLVHVVNLRRGPLSPQPPPSSISVVVETPRPPSNLPFIPAQTTVPLAEPTQSALNKAPLAEPTQLTLSQDVEVDSSLPANVRSLTSEFFDGLGHIGYNYKGIPKGDFVLTFDDGPNPKVTPKVLDTLKEHGVQGAVFFVTGQNAQRYPDLLRRIVDEGHVLGGHTWNHPSLTSLSKQQALSELTRTDEAVDKALGYDYPLNLVRPPYGATNTSVLETIGEAYGGNSVLWQVDSEDWKVQSDLRQGKPTTSLVDRVLAGANQVDRRGTGGVILMHDIHFNTGKELGKVLDALKSRGYRIISITDIGQTDSVSGGLANQ